jgi:hypothetical protein
MREFVRSNQRFKSEVGGRAADERVIEVKGAGQGRRNSASA